MKCTKIHNARAQLLFSLLNILFSDVLVAFVVMVCLGSHVPHHVSVVQDSFHDNSVINCPDLYSGYPCYSPVISPKIRVKSLL